MLIDSKLSEYVKEHLVEWIPDMPNGVPPEDIAIPNNHVLYRLTDEEKITDEDLKTYYEKDPNHNWGKQYENSFGVSLFDDLSKAEKLKKIPSLKRKKYVSKLTLNSDDGVVKQTTSNNYHFTWWKTKSFDINTVETIREL